MLPMPLCSLVAPLAVSALALELARPAPHPLPRVPAPSAAPSTPGAGADPGLQERIRSILAHHRIDLAHVVVLDPATGDVFAYVSTDPEAFPPTRPYPAASLMKVVTAAAALGADPDVEGRTCRFAGSPYHVGRMQLRRPRVGRSESFSRSLAMSNNQCFARLAVDRVGEDSLIAEMRRLGLLTPPAPGHLAGWVSPVREPLDLGLLGSGLAGAHITPLAAARLAGALATGELVEPQEPGSAPRGASRRVWPGPLADRLRALLVEVTETGTARHPFRDRRRRPLLAPLRVSGKTGSLSGTDPEGYYQWFIGVAPADEPRVAIAAVTVDGPVSASRVAADTLRAIFCEGGPCAAERAAALHGRARALAAANARESARRAIDAQLAQGPAEPAPLDALPRPVERAAMKLPPRLLRQQTRGEIVLAIDLDRRGEVIDVRVESSDLPDFESFVVRHARRWRFTPPTRHGVPVPATARIPVPIVVQ